MTFSGEDSESVSQEPPNLMIGPDAHNQCVVVETHGLCGGIFISQAEALRYARQESHGRPEYVQAVPYVLDFSPPHLA